jgi:hypothetical protein
MPLKKSITTKAGQDEHFTHWKSGELNIGRSKKKVPVNKQGQKQAVAIMLSMQEQAKKKKKKVNKSDAYWESFEDTINGF